MAEESYTIVDGEAKELPGGKRLYRSTTNRTISGVCGGIGEYLGVDVGLVRVLWLLSLFFTAGISLFIYVGMAVFVPEESAEQAAGKAPATTTDLWLKVKENRTLVFGSLLMLGGLILLLNNFDFLPWRLEHIWNTFWSLFWPLVLIGGGIVLLLSMTGRAPDWSRLQKIGAGLPLRRSREDRIIAGVCGGLGNYLKVDPMVVRIAWVVLSFLTIGTVGVLLYIVAAVFIPMED
ncbi:MAG: PspC domain-containing protein [Chloroflexota bacterium]|nr:PspC domain-containing protein [Chloroflexota bacterium]